MREGCPVTSGFNLSKVYSLRPSVAGNKYKRCLALDGQLKHEDTNLASSTYFPEGFPLGPGFTLSKTFGLTPLLANNKDKWGLALDGQLKHEDTNLASSTLINTPSQREHMAIVVQYKVKVKLSLGALGGDLVAELPFMLMHPKPLEENGKAEGGETGDGSVAEDGAVAANGVTTEVAAPQETNLIQLTVKYHMESLNKRIQDSHQYPHDAKKDYLDVVEWCDKFSAAFGLTLAVILAELFVGAVLSSFIVLSTLLESMSNIEMYGLSVWTSCVVHDMGLITSFILSGHSIVSQDERFRDLVRALPYESCEKQSGSAHVLPDGDLDRILLYKGPSLSVDGFFELNKSILPAVSDGSLTLPLLVDAEQQTIISSAFQAAHMCLKLGGSLPEVVDSHDLVIFKQELDNLGLSQDTACYLGISRWDDYIRGIDNGTLYKDPETGLEIPLNDGEYWYPNTPTHPNRGQYNLFYNSQSNSGSRLISPEDPENPPVTSTLVCSTNAPERLCYFPPWIPGTVRTSSDYPYPPLANAFYWCPTGHVMSIRGQDMEREHKAVCLGNIGWSILPEYYHNATCKLT
ncbi:unnamed protein product, partial [Notodromas monacha]